MITTLKHAHFRPPSAAMRWLSCPGSVTVVPKYKEHGDESDDSLKGTLAHTLLENGILFGITPDTDNADMDLAVRGVIEHIKETRQGYGKECVVCAERRYQIPETGEFGTADVTFVTPKVLDIRDYKNGYVTVDVPMNAQLMTYLLGAIAEFGERPKYTIGVYQPNYNHIDGPYRSKEVTAEDVEWFRNEVKAAVRATDFRAGKHCKKSYCPHRGACKTFNQWLQTEGADGWFTSEVNALTDAELTQALDHSDIVQGIRDELRKEAMRRIMLMDRSLDGYKIVRSRQDRSFAGDDAVQQVAAICTDLGATDADLYARKFESVAGIERFIKQKYKNFGNGKWKQAWENSIAPHVREFSGSLTLERATDGRPAHVRGSEFGPITLAAQTNSII
jgi:Protein of unknown function (DUF2800)